MSLTVDEVYLFNITSPIQGIRDYFAMSNDVAKVYTLTASRPTIAEKEEITEDILNNLRRKNVQEMLYTVS